MTNFGLAIHGGAGTILKRHMTPQKEKAYQEALLESLRAGYQLLESGASALEAVTAAVVSMEDCPLFNAGKGSVFSAEGKHEMDASIMEGKSRQCGAVAGIQNLKNPILLAKKVLEESEHVFLIDKGAMKFAHLHQLETVEDQYFYDELRFQQWQSIKDSDSFQLDHSDQKFGTVGAVALDQEGNLAAATSTGGMTNKRFGRVGDSSIIGAGTYANNHTCAVSCTGSGEFFIRGVVAYDVSCLMEYKNLSLEKACEEVIQKRLKTINGDGGLIAIDRHGNISMPFNTEGMYRGCVSNTCPELVEIYKK